MFGKTRIAAGLIVALLLIIAAACTSAAASETLPENTRTPVTPTETPIAYEEVLAPIVSVEVIVSESGDYSLKVVSGLPSGCAEFNGISLEQDGNALNVTVNNLMPVGPIACTEIYGMHESTVELPGLTAGQAYGVVVNGALTNSFTVLDDDRPMLIADSPIESVEVVQVEGGYELVIVSQLPMGSSCSKFNGYDVIARYIGRIDVTVTHYQIDDSRMDGPVACTADLSYVETRIALGDEIVAGEYYDIIVNDVTQSFTPSR